MHSSPRSRRVSRPGEHSLGMTEQTTHLRVSGPTDLLAIVPYWLGYRPSDCVVLMAESDGRIQSGCALTLDQCADAATLSDLAEVLETGQQPASYLLIAYGESARAEPALIKVTAALKGKEILQSILVDQGHYWLPSEGERTGSDAGHALDVSVSPATAAAVQAGLQVFGSRDEVAALVKGPDGTDDEAAHLWREASASVSRWGTARRKRLVDQCLQESVKGLHQPDAQRCAQLGAAVQDIAVRDHAWLAMDLEDGWRHQQLWLWVVAATPACFCAPVLCLAAVASWLSGGGALFTECVNRAERLHPDYSMLRIVRELHDCAVPPYLWRDVSASLREQESSEWL